MRFSVVVSPCNRSIPFIALTLALVSSLAGCSSVGTKPSKTVSSEQRARLYLNVAIGSLTEGDPVGALQNLATAQREADLPEIHHTRALAFHMQHDDEHALAEAKRAVEMNPKYSEADNTYGKLLMDRGRYRDAVAPLTQAAEDPLSRNAYRAYTNLGILYYRQGDYASARKDFSHAIDLDQNQSCIAHYYLGHLDLRESKMKDAILEYEKATKRLCNDFADAHYALGIALERDRQFDRARRKFLEVQERYPKSPLADEAFDQLRKIP